MAPTRRQTPIARPLAEDEKILLSRVGFLSPFLQDARVRAFVREADREVGLLTATAGFAHVGTELARQIGCRRTDLWLVPSIELAAAIDAVPMSDDYRALLEETLHAMAEVVERYGRVDRPVFTARVDAFVRQLGLPWRWLADELVEHYYGEFFALFLGRHATRGHFLATAAVHPLLPAPHEELRDTCERQLETAKLADDWCDELRRRSRRAGAMFDGQQLERYAEWFYRLRVKRPADSADEIASDYRIGPETVGCGIRIVEPLLDQARLP